MSIPLTRPVPFTPKRPLSTSSTILASTHKKYRAPLSTEAKSRIQAKSTSLNVPGSNGTNNVAAPKSPSRPRTPGTPRKGAESPSLLPAAGEMDVSNVDPEDVLVDYQSVEPGDGDISGEIDEEWVRDALLDLDREDEKVMVSIRIRSSDGPSSAFLPPSATTLSLNPKHAKATSSMPMTYTFPLIHTTPSTKPLYLRCARPLVHAAMSGYNAVIFAYGQTASGKTYTLSGDPAGLEPGIIPRAMRDVFACIRRTSGREYLLRCSYLEIYNESVFDLLAPPEKAKKNPVQIVGAGGDEIVLTPLREEVVTSLAGVLQVLQRGEGNRRTACTDWNERSSRSHSVLRMVIESRERVEEESPGRARSQTPGPGRRSYTPGPATRSHTPGPGMRSQTPGPGAGPRLQARGGRSVRVSVLSLIDLAGSEKATSDKERTREGKYINTSLLTLGTVIGTLADNSAKRKSDHIPYRNSKLTRLLQPSLSGNARISVVCTLNPDPAALAESLSTLGFARRVGGVKLNAQKKEVEDTDALIERYRKEIEDLKARLAEREREVIDVGRRGSVGVKRRLSAREQMNESKAMQDLNTRIQQLTKLILTSQTVDELKGGDGDGDGDGDEDGTTTAPGSPAKVDFDMSPYQLQQQLLSARMQIESQTRQILSLEAALEATPAEAEVGSADFAPTSTDGDKERMIEEQAKRIAELEGTMLGYEAGERVSVNEEEVRRDVEKKIRAEVERRVRDEVKEEMEKEWIVKVEEERRKNEEGEQWTKEVVKQLEKEKKMRTTLEEERRALAAFVSKFDSLGLGLAAVSASSSSSSTSLASSSSSTLSTSSSGTLVSPSSSSSSLSSLSKLKPPMPSVGGAAATFAERRALAVNGLTLARSELIVQKLPSVVEVEGSTPARPPSVSRVVAMDTMEESPFKMTMPTEVDIMREVMPEEADLWRDVSFDAGMQEGDDDDEVRAMLIGNTSIRVDAGVGGKKLLALKKGGEGRVILGDKENVVPS